MSERVYLLPLPECGCSEVHPSYYLNKGAFSAESTAKAIGRMLCASDACAAMHDVATGIDVAHEAEAATWRGAWNGRLEDRGVCEECRGTQDLDSGGVHPSGYPISNPCPCGDGTEAGLCAVWRQRAETAEATVRALRPTVTPLVAAPPEGAPTWGEVETALRGGREELRRAAAHYARMGWWDNEQDARLEYDRISALLSRLPKEG